MRKSGSIKTKTVMDRKMKAENIAQKVTYITIINYIKTIVHECI